MLNFICEDGKYRVICSDDHKHNLLVGHRNSEIAEYCSKKGLVADQKERKYIVYEGSSSERFFLAKGALIRRLAPFDKFDALYKYFYTTPRLRLVVDAIYVGPKDANNPFTPYNEKHGPLTKMELPHA